MTRVVEWTIVINFILMACLYHSCSCHSYDNEGGVSTTADNTMTVKGQTRLPTDAEKERAMRILVQRLLKNLNKIKGAVATQGQPHMPPMGPHEGKDIADGATVRKCYFNPVTCY